MATWLLTIARNVAVDAARLRGAQPMDPDVLAGSLQLTGSAGAPDELDPAPNSGSSARAISDLPHRASAARSSRAAYLGRTAREIGELDGIPVGTVKTRIRTAMIRLRAALEGSHEV